MTKIGRVLRRLLAAKLASPSAETMPDSSFKEDPKYYALEIPRARYESLRRPPTGV